MVTLAPSFLIGSSSFLQVTRICIKTYMSSNLGQIPLLTTELATLERLKLLFNLVATLAPSFLIGSSIFHVMRTTVKSWMSSNVGSNCTSSRALLIFSSSSLCGV